MNLVSPETTALLSQLAKLTFLAAGIVALGRGLLLGYRKSKGADIEANARHLTIAGLLCVIASGAI